VVEFLQALFLVLLWDVLDIYEGSRVSPLVRYRGHMQFAPELQEAHEQNDVQKGLSWGVNKSAQEVGVRIGIEFGDLVSRKNSESSGAQKPTHASWEIRPWINSVSRYHFSTVGKFLAAASGPMNHDPTSIVANNPTNQIHCLPT